MSLCPPPQTRARASSTNLRPPAIRSTLGRRRSSSCLADQPAPPTPPSLSTTPPPPPSMLVLFTSRFLQWLHFPAKHTPSWSTPSSPRSSSDEFILPLSDSQQKVVFSLDEKPSQSLDSRLRFTSAHAPIFLVILMFPVSTAFVLWCLHTLPVSMSWPHTLSDVAQLGRELHGYSQSGPGPLAHVIAVMAISAVWKHSWSVPGSVIWNVLAGALFSPALATILLTALTTIGSLCATLLSTPLAPFLAYLFPRALDMTRSALGGDSDSDHDTPGAPKPKSSAWVRLSVLRLIGVVPWSGINIACGVCGVSLYDCMLGTFIGCLPWTAVTCQIGDILQTVASTPSPTPQTISSVLTSPAIVIKLVCLSFLSLAPILGRDRLRALISNSSRKSERQSSEERQVRWTWVQEWRTKIRLPSRSRDRRRSDDINLLVTEKRALEILPS